MRAAAAKQQRAPADDGVSHNALETTTSQQAPAEQSILEVCGSPEEGARFRETALDALVEAVPRYLTLRQALEYLRERGYPVAFSTLRRLCMPSRGGGPPVAGRWGQRLLFVPADLLSWAERRVHARPAKGPASLVLTTKAPHVEQPSARSNRRKCGEGCAGLRPSSRA